MKQIVSITLLTGFLSLGATSDKVYKTIYQHQAADYEIMKKAGRRMAAVLRAKGVINCDADGQSLTISTKRHDLVDTWTFDVEDIESCEIIDGKFKIVIKQDCPFSWMDAGIGFAPGYLAGLATCAGR